MILFAVVGESIKIFLCEDRLKLLYIWRKYRDFLLNIILMKYFGKILRESSGYIDVKSRGFRK